MDDSRLTDDLPNCSIEELLNLSFTFDPLGCIEETYQFIDTMASSIVFENSDLSAKKETLYTDQSAETSIKTVEVDTQQNSLQYIDLDKNHSPEQPSQSNQTELATLKDPEQHNATVVQLTNLKMENTDLDLSSMTNDLLTTETNSKIHLTTYQVSTLEREFQISHHVDRFTRKKLALTLNLTQLEVKEWFKNQRMEIRKLDPYKQSIRSKKRAFSKSQLAMLEREFQINRRPDCLTRQKLSLMLNAKDSQVNRWFVTRRYKMRKLNEHHRSSLLQNKSITSCKFGNSFEKQDLAQININNSQLVAIEHAFKKYPSARRDTVILSAPTLNLTNQQVQVQQFETSSQVAAIEHAFKEYQSAHYDKLYGSTSVYNLTHHQCQVPQIGTCSFSSLSEPNQSLIKNTIENLDHLVQPRTYGSTLSPPDGPPEQKRRRATLCESQLVALEREYEKSEYPNYNVVHQLASTINLTESQIKVWFKNQRAKQKMWKKRNQQRQTITCDLSLSSEPPKQILKMTGTHRQSVQQQTTTCDFQQSSEPSKRKQMKTLVGKSRFISLEREFKKCQHPNLVRICQLASKFNFTNSQVRRWFSKRRLKQRKSKKKQREVVQSQNGTFSLSPSTGIDMPKYQIENTNLNCDQFPMLENEFRNCKYPNYGYLASIFNVSYDEIRRTNKTKFESDGHISYDQQREAVKCAPSTRFSMQRCCTQKTNLNENQLAMLEDEFRKCEYPNYYHLASILNVTYDEIRDWFIIRRVKQRKLENQSQMIQEQGQTLGSSVSARSSKQKTRRRTNFSASQVTLLEYAFRQSEYVDNHTLFSLATMLDVSYGKVRTWFTNRRTKEKKLKKLAQLESLRAETAGLSLSNNHNFIETYPFERQIQQFGNTRQPPIFFGDHQINVFPQTWQFEGYNNSTSPAFLQQSYGTKSLPLIQEENQSYINPARANAQCMFSPIYAGPMNNDIILFDKNFGSMTADNY